MKLPRNFDVTSHVEFALCGHENAELHGECYQVAKEVDRDTIQLFGMSHGGNHYLFVAIPDVLRETPQRPIRSGLRELLSALSR
jgi:hypothetical protein